MTEVIFRCNYLSDDDSDNLFQYLVENLSSDIEKISLGDMAFLTDEHVKTLVKRCKKIKELEFCHCRRITEASLTSIVEHCDQMVKLDVSYTKIDLSRDWNGWNSGPIPLLLPVQGRNSFLKVKSMPKLKVFNCQQLERPSQETENLRKLMPHLEINVNQGVVLGGDLHIARPNESIEPEDGLWHIFVKSTELFPEKRFLL